MAADDDYQWLVDAHQAADKALAEAPLRQEGRIAQEVQYSRGYKCRYDAPNDTFPVLWYWPSGIAMPAG